MQTFLKHLLITAQDISALGRLKARPFDETCLSPFDRDMSELLSAPAIAAEWPDVTAACTALTLTRQGQPTQGGVNPGDRRALYTMIRTFKPAHVLEVGTHLGYSTLHIAQALKKNAELDGRPGRLTTIDIRDVNNAPDAPWRRIDAMYAPREAVARAGMADNVEFVNSDSVAYISGTDQRFDFVFLDGDHSAPVVYNEIAGLPRILTPEATVVLHDYFPDGRALWRESLPNTGPWRAVRRMQRDGARINTHWLGQLPWPTKCGTNLTSLALLHRR